MKVSQRLLAALLNARQVVAFTGAGMSAESGVPTFRGNQGLWKTFRPEELASMDAFLRNPALVWEWYAARKTIIREVEPNPGHIALVRLEALLPSLTVVTQNIDNLHRRAGSSTIFELHGNIERNYCVHCGSVQTDEEMVVTSGSPRCSSCSGLVRPDVVWFGEMLPQDQWDGAMLAIESADVILSIGTSGVVHPAAGLPLRGKKCGAYTAEINLEPTELSGWMDEQIRESSAAALPALVAELTKAQG